MKAALILNELDDDGVSRVPPLRMYDAVNVVLSYQNHDGGWATYENTRSFHALEVIPLLPRLHLCKHFACHSGMFSYL
jgi:cycloartenol synthase